MRSPLTGSPRRKSHGPIAALFAGNGSAKEAPAPERPMRVRDVNDRRRQSWRELAVMVAGLTFETDAAGVFTFVDPAPALGWNIGGAARQDQRPHPGRTGRRQRLQPISAVRAGAPPALLDPARRWQHCLPELSVMPLSEPDGTITGARGVAIDLAELDGTEAGVAAALRRADVLDHILRTLRVELLPERMMQQALRALANALGAEGALVIDASTETAPQQATGRGSRALLHEVGGDAGSVVAASCDQLRFALSTSPVASVIDGRPMILCPCPTRFGGQSGLVLWRRSGTRRWDSQDLAIVGSATSLIRVVLEHAIIQAEMATQARTDALTGLINRRSFLNEVARRIDRLDRDRLPGTMMIIALENFAALTERAGHEFGDEALRIAAALLRVTFRPGDVLSRLGSDAFAVWMDGADEMTAAERAESLCSDGPQQFAHLGDGTVAVTLSIGIAMRWTGGDEDVTELSRRADLALGQVKGAGGGAWRVWHAEQNENKAAAAPGHDTCRRWRSKTNERRITPWPPGQTACFKKSSTITRVASARRDRSSMVAVISSAAVALDWPMRVSSLTLRLMSETTTCCSSIAVAIAPISLSPSETPLAMSCILRPTSCATTRRAPLPASIAAPGW